jgi:hypothetical protein
MPQLRGNEPILELNTVSPSGLLRTKHQYSIEKPQEKYSTP